MKFIAPEGFRSASVDGESFIVQDGVLFAPQSAGPSLIEMGFRIAPDQVAEEVAPPPASSETQDDGEKGGEQDPPKEPDPKAAQEDPAAKKPSKA